MTCGAPISEDAARLGCPAEHAGRASQAWRCGQVSEMPLPASTPSLAPPSDEKTDRYALLTVPLGLDSFGRVLKHRLQEEVFA